MSKVGIKAGVSNFVSFKACGLHLPEFPSQSFKVQKSLKVGKVGLKVGLKAIQ